MTSGSLVSDALEGFALVTCPIGKIPILNVKIYNYFEFRYKVNLFSFI